MPSAATVSEKPWNPALRETSGPVYRDLVQALETDIRSGALKPGDRLPTHRELATSLGLSRGTVARAYEEAQRLGLIQSGIGQGTYVSHDSVVQARREPDSGEIDLGMGFPLYELDPDPAAALSDLAADAARMTLLRYPSPEGRAEHRAAGSRWCAQMGLEAAADEVVVTAGGQHAIHLWLLSALRRGDTLLTGELTYRMTATAAQMLGIEVRGVAIDDQGLLPGSLDAVAAETGARGLYAMPTFRNPTAGTCSEDRRRQLAEVIRARRLRVLEDDIHGPFHPPPRPVTLKALCPDQVTYVASLSKIVAGGLRVAFAVPPAAEKPNLFSALIASIWSPPPLTAEIACRWIDDGTAAAVMRAKQREAEIRLELLRRRLGPLVSNVRTGAYFAWLELPEPWTATRFALAARHAGVTVMPAEAFFIGDGAPPEAVRIAMGAVTREQVERGLSILAKVLERVDGPLVPIV